MRISIYVLALTPLLFAGCAEAPTTVTTTTTTQITTTGPRAREVVVTQAPPPLRVEVQTVSPGPRYVWTRGYWRWTGAGYEWAPRDLDRTPKSRDCMGGGSLGAQGERLGVGRRLLAVT